MSEDTDSFSDLSDGSARGRAEAGRHERLVMDLIETIADLSSPLDLKAALQVTAEQMCHHLSVEACAISRWDPEADALSLWIDHVPKDWEVGSAWPETVQLKAYPLIQDVVHRQKVVHCSVDDAELDPAIRSILDAREVQSLLLLPLVVRERSVGLIELLDRRTARTFSTEQVSLGLLLASHAAIAIERAHLLGEARQRAAELEAVRQASLGLTASLDLPVVLDAILHSTMALIPDSEGAHVFLFEEEKLKFGAALWEGGRRHTPFAEPRPDGLTYTVARTAEPVVVDDMSAHPLYEDAPPEWTGSIVGLPLKISDRVVGVMNVANNRPHAFTESELRVLRLLGDQAAIAIENARLHDLVSRQAQTDIITGLANRRALNNRLDEEVRRARRYNGTFTLVMMDLDNFKLVNDSFGHPVGDQVLSRIGACLQQVVRDSDFLARFGGDEFALLLTETDEKDALTMTLRVNASLTGCDLGLPKKLDLALTFSIGMANYPRHALTSTALLVAADNALYQAKELGPGKAVSAGELERPPEE